MERLPREQWPPYHFLTTVLLFCVASSELVFLCLFLAPSTPAQVIKTVYLLRQNSSVDALRASTGSLRWHHQLDHQWNVSGSLLADRHVVYVGRVSATENSICTSDCPSYTYTGSVDALKASTGSLLWHHPIDVPNDAFAWVQVIKVIDGVVYVGVGAWGNDSAGDVYALRADTGSLLWHYRVKGRCCGGLVATKTAVYVGEVGEVVPSPSDASHVDALKASDGTMLWRHHIDRPRFLRGEGFVGMAVADGVVYVGTGREGTGRVNIGRCLSKGMGCVQGAVDALRASDGSLIWHSQTDFAPFMLTVADGVLYVEALLGFTVDALRASDGSLLWQYQSDRLVGLLTVLDGVAYMTTFVFGNEGTGGTVDALRVSDGSHLWRYKLAQGAIKGLEVANGMIYVNTSDGIAALQANSGNQRWFHPADDELALTGGP